MLVDGQEVEWSNEWIEAEAAKRELLPDAETAAWFYEFANLGDVKRFTGKFWSCCPRSLIVEGAPRHPSLDGVAAVCLGAARDLQRGLPSNLIMDGRNPSQAVGRGIRLAYDVMEYLNRLAQQRQLDEMSRNSGGKK